MILLRLFYHIQLMVLPLLLSLLTLQVLWQDMARSSTLEAAEICQSGEWGPVSGLKARECLVSQEPRAGGAEGRLGSR